MERADFLSKLGRILERDPGELTEDLRVKPRHWDSVETMGAIALIDQAGATITVAQLHGCHTIGEVLQLAGIGRPKTC